MPEAWTIMLHLLVFAYWLGGDLGAFTASFTLTDTNQAPAARLAAAKILNQADLAPRSALILTLPTGLTLAVQKGWIDVRTEIVLAVWTLSVIWLVGLWVQHVSSTHSATWRMIDLSIRLALIGGLAVAAFAVTPFFLKVKVVALALATLMGLAIRVAVAPIGIAVTQLAKDDVSPETNRILIQSLARARPMVVAIWLCLFAAAWAGVAKPI